MKIFSFKKNVNRKIIDVLTSNINGLDYPNYVKGYLIVVKDKKDYSLHYIRSKKTKQFKDALYYCKMPCKSLQKIVKKED
jgi:hypothetical protein